MLADAQSAIHALIGQRVTAGIVPGAVYTVFTANGVGFSGAYGTAAADGRPPSVDTAFRVASCTKSFTAAAILQLRDAGVLTLEDSISDFVDIGVWELPGSEPPPLSTVGALLSMSGGLATDNPWADRQESMSDADFTDLCRRGFTLASRPGTRYEYSNLGYALLGRIIQRASGIGYREFVTSRLLRPLDLQQTAFDTSTATACDGIADGFVNVHGRWQPAPVTSPGAFSPIGGLYMTANDLTSWCRWLAAGYPLGASGDRTLAASSRREMQQIHQLDPLRMHQPIRAAGYGYGLEVELHDEGIIVSHRGGYPGFSAQMAWHPATQLGVVVLENASYAQSPAIAALQHVLAADARPARTDLWPVTLNARYDIEQLLARWDDAVADRIFADNLDLDLPRLQRRAQFASAAAAVDFTDDCRQQPLELCEPVSTSPAHLEWAVRGQRGQLRCAVTLTSLNPPKVQSITFPAEDRR
ncbi:beta-lactamase family protein [Mycolicibacterium boenickei]|nr:beta-lactamase family protein [Mycolicibacterium boenickei]